MKVTLIVVAAVALCAALVVAQPQFGGPGGGGPFGGGGGGGSSGGSSSNSGNSYNNGGSSSNSGNSYNNGGSSSSPYSSSSSSSSSPQPECRTGCCNTGNRVFKGECKDFSNYFNKGDSDAATALSESDSAFQTRVNGAPTPSDSCCTVARSFVQSGCSCNQQLKDAAKQQGFSNNAVSVISRAVRQSICSNSGHGGSISSGGC